MTRFQLLDGPRRYPHRDIILNDTRQENPVFDLGIELDSYDGAVYIQIDHIQEMARSIGMLSKEQADELIEENQRLRAQIDALPEKAQELTDGMARLVDNFRFDLNHIGTSVPAVEDGPNDESDEPESDSAESEAFRERIREMVESAQITEPYNESSGVERPASVRESRDDNPDSIFE